MTRCNSYFDVGAQFVGILIAKFKKEKFQNRRIQIDYAERPFRSNFKDRGYKGRSRSPESFFSIKEKKTCPVIDLHGSTGKNYYLPLYKNCWHILKIGL